MNDRVRARFSSFLPVGVALGAFLAGCSVPAEAAVDGGAGGTDAAGADAPPTDSPLSDVAAADAPGAPGTDAGGVCEPTTGPATGGGYCDLFELAVFTFDDAAPEARLYGRVTPDGFTAGGCAVVDEVEIQRGGAVVGTLPGVGTFAPGSETALLAQGPPLLEMTTRCEGDLERFGGFGLVVRGRVDGGSFEAHCADAEGGSRWPPAIRITCHHGVEGRPVGGYAMVSDTAMFDSTSLSAYVPHGPGGALTAVDSTVHVIPGFAPALFGPPPPMLDPFDATPFTTAGVTESTLPGTSTMTSNLSLLATEVLFPLAICPPPSTGPPGPGDPLPPVFLARLTGTGERGAFSTEAYVNFCITSSR